MLEEVTPVILAGGSGTRLWPLSRADYPKQFLSLGRELTLLQQTATRLAATDAKAPVLVCSEQHRFLTAEQLMTAGIRTPEILLEPVGRNTAPAIAVAAWRILARDPDGIMVVMPADHQIPDSGNFATTIASAIIEAKAGKLVTLGIKPIRPDTGYGYIQASSPSPLNSGAHMISRFMEKPDAAKAEQLIEAGDCYWNAGIFIFSAQQYLDSLEKYSPEMHKLTQLSVEAAEHDLDFVRLSEPHFSKCENISVDYAVMEHSTNSVMIPFSSGWSDIGSWDAVHQVTHKDERGNALVGDVIAEDCDNCHVHSESRLVTVLGLKNVSVVETADAVMVMDMSHAQSMRKIVESLRADARDELTTHRICYRPWGHHESLNLDERFQVKRITVKPSATLSLQKHFHRSEHWVVVKGTAVVTNGEQEIMLTENQSTYIPLGAIHRLHNPGVIPLELIEVQSGSYLGEDDIVRIGDEYGRN